MLNLRTSLDTQDHGNQDDPGPVAQVTRKLSKKPCWPHGQKFLVVLWGFCGSNKKQQFLGKCPRKVSVLFLKIEGYMPDIESEPFLDSLRITPLQVESTKRTAHTHTANHRFPFSILKEQFAVCLSALLQSLRCWVYLVQVSATKNI